MSNRRVCTLNESILKQGRTSVVVIVNKNKSKGMYDFKNQGSVNSRITKESRGDVTCDSLGDVTWSHGTYDVKRSVGKVRRIWMRKQHQEGQNRIVMSMRGFLLLWFRINKN